MILRFFVYVVSVKDVMDDVGLIDMVLGLGFGIVVVRNKKIIVKKLEKVEVDFGRYFVVILNRD